MMGQAIYYYLEVQTDGKWKKIDEVSHKPSDEFAAMFLGKEFGHQHDRFIGTAGIPDGTTYREYLDSDYGHCWFMLEDLLTFNFDQPMLLDGQPTGSGWDWRDYLSEVLFRDNSDAGDVDDFLEEFFELKTRPDIRVLVYFDH
jgi:hypothetical protein